MGWKEIRAASRDLVHATFTRPAIYTHGSVSKGVHVRLHNKLEVFGDLDRDGFSKRFEEVNQVIFDSTEIVPMKGGVVDFMVDDAFAPIPGDPVKYRVQNITAAAGDRYIRTEVVLL